MSTSRAARIGLLSLAAFRVTRLLVRDDLPPLLALRNKIVRYRPGHEAIHYSEQRTWHGVPVAWWGGELILCPWCASAYVSAALVAYDRIRNGPARFRDDDLFIDWLSVWAGAALIHKWADS